MPDEITAKQTMEAVTALRESVEGKRWMGADQLDVVEKYLGRQEDEDKARAKDREAATESKAQVEKLVEQLNLANLDRDTVKATVDLLTLEMAKGKSGGGVANPLYYRQEEPYQKWSEWAKRGDEAQMSFEEAKQLLRTDIATDGGVLVTSEMESFITKEIEEVDDMRRFARVRRTGKKTLDLPIRDSIPVATFEGETGTGSDSVSSYKSETLTTYRETFTAPVTRDQLMNSEFDMDTEMSSDAALALAKTEGEKIILGTGNKEPGGITTNAALIASDHGSGGNGFRPGSGAAGALGANDFILVQGDIPYDGAFLFNRRTLALARVLRADAVSAADGAGNYLWNPGLNGAASNELAGAPYGLMNSMPDVAANSLSVAYGSWRDAYLILDRTGIEVIRDDFSLKKQAIVEFTYHRWMTGRVILAEAAKLIKTAA